MTIKGQSIEKPKTCVMFCVHGCGWNLQKDEGASCDVEEGLHGEEASGEWAWALVNETKLRQRSGNDQHAYGNTERW